MFQGKTNKDSVNPKDTGLSFLTKALIILVPILIYAGIYTYNSVQGAAIFGLTLNTPSLEDGLVGHWTFDGGTINGTTVSDQSGQGNSAYMVSGPTSAMGKIGQGMSFDGVDDRVDLGSHTTEDVLYTISLWFYHNNTSSSTKVLMHRGNGHTRCFYNPQINIEQDTLKAKESGCNDSGLIGTKVLSTGWHFVSVTRDQQIAKLYVDDELIATDSSQISSYDDYGKVILGAGIDNALGTSFHAFYDRKIDDVRIYNRALSAEEVQKLYRLGEGTKINSAASQSLPSLENGLVGHWTFDGSTINGATTTDQSGQGNDGTMTNGPAPTMGKIGQGMSFDGVDDYVNIDRNGVTATSAISYSFWAKTIKQHDANVALGCINGQGGSQEQFFNIDNAGVQGIRAWTVIGGVQRTLDYSITTPVNVWRHYTYIYDGATQKMYLNGAEVASGSATGTVSAVTESGCNDSVRVGSNVGPSSASYFNGSLDDVRIYNRALSATEVDQLYQLGKPTKINSASSQSVPVLETGLVGHWTFDGSTISGTTVADQSGQGNNGTIIGGATPTIGKIGQGMSFDGVDDYIDLGDHNVEQTTYSISLWFKTNSNSSGTLFRRGVSTADENSCFYNPSISVSDSTTLVVHESGCSNSGVIGTITVGENVWNNVTVVRSGTTVGKVYINGIVEATDTSLPVWPGVIGNFYIGAQNNTYDSVTNHFEGSLDDVRIYNRALSAEEIQLLYKMGAR